MQVPSHRPVPVAAEREADHLEALVLPADRQVVQSWVVQAHLLVQQGQLLAAQPCLHPQGAQGLRAVQQPVAEVALARQALADRALAVRSALQPAAQDLAAWASQALP